MYLFCVNINVYLYVYKCQPIYSSMTPMLSSVCQEETENLNSLPALPQPLSLNRPPRPIITRAVEPRALHGRSCMATFDCRGAHLGIPRLASCSCPSLQAQGYPHGHRRRHVPMPPA